MPREFHIASLVVFTTPEHVDNVASGVLTQPSAQVHGSAPSGKLVVTLEGHSSGEIMDQVGGIQSLPGVINVALVYQSIEPEEDGQRVSS